MQACGNRSLSLRFSSDIWVNTECKAIFAVARFNNSSGWSILQNVRGVLILVSLSVAVSTYRSTLIVRFVYDERSLWKKYQKQARFYWSLWMRSQTFAAPVSKWFWQVLLADPAIRGRATGQSPLKILKNMFSWIYQLAAALLAK